MYAMQNFTAISARVHTHTHTQLNSSTANMSDASNGIQTLSLSFTHICHTFSTLFFSCIFAQCRINLTLYNATLQSVFTIAAPATATAEKKITLFIMYDFQWIQTGTAFPSKRFSRKETQIDSILKCVFFSLSQLTSFSILSRISKTFFNMQSIVVTRNRLTLLNNYKIHTDNNNNDFSRNKNKNSPIKCS